MRGDVQETNAFGGDTGHGEGMGGRGSSARRRVCRFCTDTTTTVGYKDVHILKSFVTERGKIFPRRLSGTCSKHQRKVAEVIKQARMLALMPFTVTGR